VSIRGEKGKFESPRGTRQEGTGLSSEREGTYDSYEDCATTELHQKGATSGTSFKGGKGTKGRKLSLC